MGIFNFDFSAENQLKEEIAKRRLEALRSGEIGIDEYGSLKRQRAGYDENNRQRDEAWAGMTALQEVRKNIIETEREKSYLEDQYPRAVSENPQEALRISLEIRQAAERLKDFKDVENIKKAETFFKFVDSSRAPSMTAQYVAQILGMKNLKDAGRDDYVEVSQESQDPDTGQKTTRKWRERPQPMDEDGSYSQASYYRPDNQEIFNNYQTGNMPSITPSGYSSGFGNIGSGQYLSGNNQPEISAPAQPAPATTPAQAQPAIDPAQVRAEALQILSNPNVPPEKKQRVREKAAQYGIQL